jgi:stalled ribosome rescue protein Dom34
MDHATGIWLDQSRAVIVQIKEEGIDVTEVPAVIDRKHRSTGGVGASQPFWHRTVTSGTRENERRKHEIQSYFKSVYEAAGGGDKVAIFGPGKMKLGLQDYLLTHGCPADQIKKVESTHSRMSQGEIVALVREHFGMAAPRFGKKETLS